MLIKSACSAASSAAEEHPKRRSAMPSATDEQARYSPQAIRLLDDLQYLVRSVLREKAIKLSKQKTAPAVVTTDDIRAAVDRVGDQMISQLRDAAARGKSQDALRSRVA
jgi:hypothetical protein